MTLSAAEEHLYRLIPKDFRLSALSDVENIRRDAVKAERDRIRSALHEAMDAGRFVSCGGYGCMGDRSEDYSAVLVAIDGEEKK